MMIRLFASALLVAGLSQAALAQSSNQQNQPSNSQQSTQAPQNLPQELRQRLTSAGFSDIKIMPSSFVVSAKNKDGKQVLMRITPTSMTVLTETPVPGSSTTGAGSGQGTGSSGNSTSPNQSKSSPNQSK